MTVTREQVYGALFALAQTITWDTSTTFAFTSRRVKLWAELPAVPALCQAEHGETMGQVTRMPYKRVFAAKWFIYHRLGKDPEATPAILNNVILDAVQAAMAPKPPDPGYREQRQTLGGLVHHCWIDGNIMKDPGDLDGDALMLVPISLLVP